MDFFDVVLKRRTYRGDFLDKPISKADVDAIIESARWSPSPFNIQPWEILLVTKQSSKDALSELVLQSMSQQMADPKFLDDVSKWMNFSKEEWTRRGEGVMIDDHVDLPNFIRDKTKLRPLLKNARNLSFLGKMGLGKISSRKFAELIKRSPLIIIVLKNCSKVSPGGNRYVWELLSMGAFIEHILLAATSLGIGTHFINSPLETKKDRDKLRALFNIPDNYEPVSLIRAGYIQGELEPSVRLSKDKFVHYEVFGERKG